MAQQEFSLPAFLKGNSTEEIHQRMMDSLPAGIDKGEGGFPWDFTRPTALEKAQMVEFVLTQAIRNLFPQWAEGTFLEYHAANRGILRRAASNATALLNIQGIKDCVIPAGFQVTTEASLTEESTVFSFLQEVCVPQSGQVQARVVAAIAGKAGNVAAGTILLQMKPLKGIVSICNEEAASGGFEAESDDDLRERILNYDRQQGQSFVGSPADYRRWALSVSGVGSVKCTPATDKTGVVTLTVTDLEGQPANEALCQAVHDFIMRPDRPEERLAPINANLRVIPPQILQIAVSAAVTLKEGYTISLVQESFLRDLISFFSTAELNGVVRYSEVGAVLIQTEGIQDYANLTLNEGLNNLVLQENEMPVVDSSRVILHD